ncbi:MAG: FAD-dependent monooxygenase [Actinomycetota bacterium]|nr:FAD-dependent monooxygenase [Actinomycetota bacterium]
MKIASIGGGPAGLFFSIMMKKADPSHEITVFERNAPDATFGFGVVFSERTMDYLEEADEETFGALTEASAEWTDIEVRHKGRVLRCGGNGFSAIARRHLLLILQERARSLDVDLRFEQEVDDPTSVEGYYDLVVAGDGLNSGTRETYSDHFEPQVDVGLAKYIWLGTAQPFDALTFIFIENEHGCFGVHAYPSDGEISTFIVETDEGSWRRAGLDRTATPALAPGESDEESRVYCEEIFAEHLGEHELLTNNSKWLNFHTVRNATWRKDNVVIFGDAAHTAHFSVGSGTRMAMEDAIALARAVAERGTVPEALEEFESRRRPAVERIQAAAGPSQAWWEHFRYQMSFEPEKFAYHFLTRNPRLTHERLRVRDPRLVRHVEAWFERKVSPDSQEQRARPVPSLATPLTLREVTLPNRVSVVSTEEGIGEARNDVRLARVAGAATWGAGLVTVSGVGLRDDADVAAWRRISSFVHEHSPARLGLLVNSAEGSGELIETTRRANESGFDVLELSDPEGALGRDLLANEAGEGANGSARLILAALARVREAWPEEKPVVVHLSVPEEVGGDWEVGDGVAEFAAELRTRGCDAVAVSPVPELEKITTRHRVAQLAVSDRIRNVGGMTTMLAGGVPGDDEATTAVLSGRADLCRGRPGLASPLWERDEASERAPTGTAPMAVVGKADGSTPS